MKKLVIITLLFAFVMSFTASAVISKPAQVCRLAECVYSGGSWVWYICCDRYLPNGEIKTTCEISNKPCPPPE